MEKSIETVPIGSNETRGNTSGSKAEQVNTAGPDREPYHIVIAADNAYGIPALVTLLSLVENARKDTLYKVHVMAAPEFDPAYVRAIDEVLRQHGMPAAHVVNMRGSYEGAHIRIPHTTVQTFYRLRIPSLVKCDKCLYLDVDTVVLGDLSDLFAMDLGDDYVAGVKAAGYYWPAEQKKRHAERLGMEVFDQYVNAGVLMMNVAAMRKNGLESEFERLAGMWYESQDQDVINVACYNHIRLLPPRYNSMTKYRNANPALYGKPGMECVAECYSLAEWKHACYEPVIVHYADRVKPWDSLAVEHAWDWWKYALLLQGVTGLGVDLMKRAVDSELTARDLHCKQLQDARSQINAMQQEVLELKEFRTDAQRAIGAFSAAITCRVDLKIEGEAENTVEIVSVSDAYARVTTPGWFQKDGTGYVIESWASQMAIVAKPFVDGTLKIILRARDVRDENGRGVAKWIRYQSVLVDGEEQLKEPCAVWHNKPRVFEIACKTGRDVRVQVKWDVQVFDGELRACQENLAKERAALKAANASMRTLEKRVADFAQAREDIEFRLERTEAAKLELERKLQSVKQSKAYKLGTALSRPVRVARKLLRRSS